MATMATVAEVLEAIETDLPDRVLQRYLDGAEDDVRQYLTLTERCKLPATVWQGQFPLILGAEDVLTVPSSVRGFPYVRFEGIVTVGGSAQSFTADTPLLETDAAGTGTVTPIAADGTVVTAGAFVVSVDEDGTSLTFDATATSAPLFVQRILGLQSTSHPALVVNAVMDLVQLNVVYRGLRNERVGQYGAGFLDFHEQRGRVLERLVYASNESLVA